MIESFIILFRETLEACLIIGIIAVFIKKIGSKQLNSALVIWLISGILASVAGKYKFEEIEHIHVIKGICAHCRAGR